MTARDPNQSYWQQYGPFQEVKHNLIRNYLNGWFPKLGTWAGRVLYVDTHAGRGQHASGKPGSPLVALRTLLEHSYRDKLLQKSEIHFIFIECDLDNLNRLKTELNGIGERPDRIHVHPREGDAYAVLNDILNDLRSSGQRMAPAFIFVDPYGFKAQLMAAGHVELFVNVIWRELDMAIRQEQPAGHGMAAALDDIFAGDEWRKIEGRPEERIRRTVTLLSNMVGAKWSTHIRMKSGGSAVRYLLLHLTNHDQGRELMKECMWKTAPDGGFEVQQRDDHRQPLLIKPEPDLTPLRAWLLERLRQRPHAWSELENEIRQELWLPTHLRTVVKQLRADHEIEDDRSETISLSSSRRLPFS